MEYTPNPELEKLRAEKVENVSVLIDAALAVTVLFLLFTHVFTSVFHV